MTVDRPTILRDAERLVRLGKLSQAVDEYVRVLDAEPRDWATAILAGELCVKLGDTDRALEYLVRAADGLRADGLLAQARATYERILSLQKADDAATPEQSEESADLERVFAGFRREARTAGGDVHAEAQLAAGKALLVAGRIVEGLEALGQAARAPRLRFDAAALVARTYKQQGDAGRAVDWFERAAEAPAPTHEAGYALLYELAETLESLGERERALAVFMELQTEAGPYRDVASRVARLTAAGAEE